MPYAPPPAHAAALALIGAGRTRMPSTEGMTLRTMVARGFGAEDIIARYPEMSALDLWEELRVMRVTGGMAGKRRAGLMRLFARRAVALRRARRKGARP